MTHGRTSTGRADVDIAAPHFFQDFFHRQTGQLCLETLASLKTKDELQIFLLAAIVQKTVIADLLKTGRQHMHHQSADELPVCDGNFLCTAIFVVLCTKSRTCLTDIKYPGICDGYAVGVPSKIFNGVAKAVKGLLDIRTPLLFVKGVAQLVPFIAVSQLFAGIGEMQSAGLIICLQVCEEFSAELGGEYLCRDKKMVSACFQLMVPSQPAAGYDAVDMRVKIQFLPPCMENLYDSWRCTEILWIGRQFQECLSAAPVEQGIQEPLVCVDERVEFCGQGEHHMEIRRVNDLAAAAVDPEFLEDGLTVRAVAVSAGVGMDIRVATLRAGADVVSECPRLAVHDAKGRFLLDIIRLERLAEILPAVFEDLGDCVVSHSAHPLSNQRDLVHRGARWMPGGHK